VETLERRAFVDCRVDAIDNRRLRGYAIVFNARSQNLGGFQEIISPDAIDRTFKEAIDVRALVDHESSKVIGRLRAGTLEMKKDSRGLRVTIEPDPDISYARDIMLAVKRGDVSGMSFAFRTIEDDWNYEDENMPIRTVLDMLVSEVSIVTFPAYAQTDVQVAQRSMQEFVAHRKGMSVDFARKLHQTRLA
jgi:Escherichia/Staphylococcus phage prohead protease